MKLQGTVVIVTGASRGIGKALVAKLENAGATVVGCSRSGNGGTRVMDVRDPQAVSALVQNIIKEYGTVDVLINNAGIIHLYSPLEKVSLDDYRECVDINLGSVFYGMRAVLPHMKKNNSGIIINIASMAGTVAHPNLSAYSATKFGVLGLTQTVAKELNDDDSAVCCFAVSPGGTDTDMRRELLGDAAAASQDAAVVAGVIVDILDGTISLKNGDNAQVRHGGLKDIISML